MRFWLHPVIRLVWLVLLSFVALIPSFEMVAWAFYGDPGFYDDPEYLSGVTKAGSPWKPPLRRESAILGIHPLCALVVIGVLEIKER